MLAYTKTKSNEDRPFWLLGDNVIVALVIVDCTKGQLLPMTSSMVVQ